MKYPLLLVLVCASAVSCASQKKIADMKPEDYNQVIQLEKTACFGQCPEFTLKLYDNGLAILDGRMFIEPIGLSRKLLTKKEMKTLMEICESADLFALKNSYRERVMDLPTTTLMYFKGDDVKKISGNMNFPDGFKKVVKACMEMIDQGEWQLIEPYNTK